MTDCAISYRTARKDQGPCCLCSGAIARGDRYARCASFDGGEVFVAVSHVECHDLASDLLATEAGRYYCYDRDSEGFGEWCLREHGHEMLEDDISDELKARLRAVMERVAR